jgi:hypothetical protein
MAQGFTLEYDPNVTQYRRLKVAAGTAIMQGTVLDRVRNSASAEAQAASAASVTSSIYAVAMETVGTSATSVLACIITPDQVWQADPVNQATTGALATTYAGYAGQRMILGVQTFTVGTTSGPSFRYVSNTGVTDVPNGTAFTTLSTVNNTGTDVTGTTGVFEQLGYTVTSYTAGVPTTGRIVGRFLREHAA